MDYVEEYESRGALWIHSGDPRQPHALLTSGNHSDGFFNSRPVSTDDDLIHQCAATLLKRFSATGGALEDVAWIVGPQKGATRLAEVLAEKHIPKLRWASPVKVESTGGHYFTFIDEDTPAEGDTVLLCEDVITTGRSVEMVSHATKNLGSRVLPYVLALVNRSGRKKVNGRKVVALIDHHMSIWAPEECPLCEQGSEAVCPKDNWDFLTNPQNWVDPEC